MGIEGDHALHIVGGDDDMLQAAGKLVLVRRIWHARADAEGRRERERKDAEELASIRQARAAALLAARQQEKLLEGLRAEAAEQKRQKDLREADERRKQAAKAAAERTDLDAALHRLEVAKQAVVQAQSTAAAAADGCIGAV